MIPVRPPRCKRRLLMLNPLCRSAGEGSLLSVCGRGQQRKALSGGGLFAEALTRMAIILTSLPCTMRRSPGSQEARRANNLREFLHWEIPNASSPAGRRRKKELDQEGSVSMEVEKTAISRRLAF